MTENNKQGNGFISSLGKIWYVVMTFVFAAITIGSIMRQQSVNTDDILQGKKEIQSLRIDVARLQQALNSLDEIKDDVKDIRKYIIERGER